MTMNCLPVYASGKALYRCVVCGEAKARRALRVGHHELGLCAALACINSPLRDRQFAGALPRGASPADQSISFPWAQIVHSAWAAAKASPPLPPGPTRHVYAGPSPGSAGPSSPRTFGVNDTD